MTHSSVVPGPEAPRPGAAALVSALETLDLGFAVADTPSGPAVVTGGTVTRGPGPAPRGSLPLLAEPGTGGVGAAEFSRFVYGAAIVAVLLFVRDGLAGLVRRRGKEKVA